jgi:CBS domain-containing protein
MGKSIRDVMTSNPQGVETSAPVVEAARIMKQQDVGPVPVLENGRLVGMLTDRDITVRATAEGKDPNGTPVREVMTPEVVYCFEDDDVREAARKMEEHQIRRLIVLNRDKRLAGIVALGDIAVHAPSDRLAGEITEAVSEPADVER